MSVNTKRAPGEVIRAGREAKLWTLRELAEAVTAAGVPVSHAHLSRLERGVSTSPSPKPKLRAALTKVLDLEADDLTPEPDAEPGGSTP